MKIDPKKKKEDLCQTSIGLLVERCRHWFEKQNIDGNLWFADDVHPFPLKRRDEPLHIVLFGSFLRRFLESGNWCVDQCHLWVLCEAAKQVLVQMAKVPEEKIGVIPRYELFPLHAPAREFPSISGEEEFTLVFAGRLSPTKNIEMLLRTVCFLQNEQNINVHLELFGDFDHQSHPDFGRRTEEGFRDRILKISENLNWKKPPIWHPKLGAEEWYQKDFKNPVLVNFSTFICEDFDVSLAQAQALGWPAWITEWGGHLDVIGTNVLKISSSLIGNSHEPSDLIALKARSLAAHFMRPFTTQTVEESPSGKARLPEALSITELDRLRRHFLESLGEQASRIYREGLDDFADSEEGRSFFSRYRLLFSGPGVCEKAWVVLVNDLHPSKDPSIGRAKETCSRILDEAALNNQDVLFVSLREMKEPFSMAHLLSASRILLPFSSKEVDSFVSSLKKTFPHNAPVEVWP